MISKRVLQKELGLKTIEDYFDLMFENYQNGDVEKCKDQYCQLSVPHRSECFFYFRKYEQLIEIFKEVQGKRTLKKRKQRK